MNALITVLTALLASTYGHNNARVSAMMSAIKRPDTYVPMTTTDKTGYVFTQGKLYSVFVNIFEGCYVQEVIADSSTKSGLKFASKQLFNTRAEALESLNIK